MRADVIVAGPGSLFTSVLPPLLVPDVHDGDPRVARDPHPGREPDDRAGRDRRLQRARARADDRAAPGRAAVRLRDLQHQPGSRAPGGGVRGQRRAADPDRQLRVERARQAAASSRSACRSCRSIPRARSATTPSGWPPAITALGQGKLGAWRGRRRRRGVTKCTNVSISCASVRSRSAPTRNTSTRAACTARRSTTCATGSRARPGSSSSPARSARARRRCCRRCCAASTAQTTVGRIVNTMLEPRELLETIMIDFGLEPAGRSKPLMLRDLAQYLVDQRLAGRLVLLVIDEAQNLSLGGARGAADALEPRDREIEAAADRAGRTAEPARQAGGARARAAAAAHHGQLSPAAARCRPRPANYINHRLRRAALGAPLEFPRDVDRRRFTRAAAACRASST